MHRIRARAKESNMAKPWIHAQSSARRFGGVPSDYIEIHNFLDSSKGTIADSRHRALTHTSWFLSTVLERVFGVVIKNSNGKEISVRGIGEQHILEDFGGRFIPSPQDYLEGLPMVEWMVVGKGQPPPSALLLRRTKMTATQRFKKAQEQIKKAREEANETAKAAFKEVSDELFKKHPQLVSFGWRQYTPYFNDGDECIFGAHTDYPTIRMAKEALTDKEAKDAEEYDEEEFYVTQEMKKKSKAERTPYEAAGMAVIAMLEPFDNDTLKECFGDHVTITVTRDGPKVHAYEHD